MSKLDSFHPKLTLIAAAVMLMSGCGSSSGTGGLSDPASISNPVTSAPVTAPPVTTTPPTGTSNPTITGKVLGAAMKNPTGFANSSKTSVDYNFSTTGDSVVSVAKSLRYGNAKVCVDVNANNVCDTGEDASLTAEDGSFSIATTQSGALLAVVGTDATYVDPNLHAPSNTVNVATKMMLRAPSDQVAATTGVGVVISPLSTEVLRSMEADSLAFTDAKQAIAARLSLNNTPAQETDVTVTADDVTSDVSQLADANAQNSLLNEIVALTPRYQLASKLLDRGYIIDMSVDALSDLKDAQAAAFNLEGIPRYDHLFVVIFENHTNYLIDSPANTNFYNYLNTEGNKAANYISTGSPSEPNYIAMGSGDDWGITDDSGWNCVPAGDTADAVTDVYNPRGDCTADTNHNFTGRRNVFSAMYAAGLPTRIYSESMDPGQDPRVDGNGNAAIMGTNAVSMQQEAMISSLYKTKHNPAINQDEIRNRPDFFRNLSRTVGGGEWDAGIASYAKANGITWNTHQLEDDLVSGDVGALNYIVPDQCDDIHGNSNTILNCETDGLGIERGDAYVKYIVETIKASPLWKNTARKVGIVMIFDEGSIGTGANSASCCGWNSGGADTSGAPIGESYSSTPIANYSEGDKGDYSSIFGLLTNQPNAPKKIVDSDTYSHFSFVRTLQDLYGLADPGVPESYMNRSKYTQSYIAAHLSQLTEYASSANTHYDAVRPMNHAYAVKIGDMGANDMLIVTPDATQTNIWALK